MLLIGIFWVLICSICSGNSGAHILLYLEYFSMVFATTFSCNGQLYVDKVALMTLAHVRFYCFCYSWWECLWVESQRLVEQ